MCLNLDLSDFFDHFHFGRVMGYFEKITTFVFRMNLSGNYTACLLQGTAPTGRTDPSHYHKSDMSNFRYASAVNRQKIQG